MIKEIVRDEKFLAQKSESATIVYKNEKGMHRFDENKLQWYTYK